MSDGNHNQKTQKTPYSIGLDAGEAYCEAASNDGMADNPLPVGSDAADQWQEGFNRGVEMWESRYDKQ